MRALIKYQWQGKGGPPSGIDPQQGGMTGGRQDGQQAPPTWGTTANA